MVDVNAWRKVTTTSEIIDFVSKNISKLKLSDQDAINMIFEDKILFIDERKYNLDEKTYAHYAFYRKIDMNWVDQNTVIVHFNGSQKPWNVKKYRGKLGGYFERFR
jgi:UDP-glucose:(glucosyl)LPS alpha-1,3-glucosyltransferase/UDP-glucose:(galactosyl)LPS alpha-1,2-glucosyltransferase